jgi:hypothetical protein
VAPAKGPSALPPLPEEGERPRLIDSSLELDIDNGRGGSKVRTGVSFAIHGFFEADDVVRLRLTTPGGRAVSKPVLCPQRASKRSGIRLSCRAKGAVRAGELPLRNATYGFRIELVRRNKPSLLRKGRFRVFKCSYGLCLDKDYRTAEHWAEFEGRRLTFRFTIKRRPAMPALHPSPKRQTKAKPGFALTTVSTRCKRGKKQVGKTSESFEVLDDDGIYTALRARAGLGIKQLEQIGKGKLRCAVRINGTDTLNLDFRVGDDGALVVHKKQRSGRNSIIAPWFWLDARRPRRLDRKARVGSQARRLRLLGR